MLRLPRLSFDNCSAASVLEFVVQFDKIADILRVTICVPTCSGVPVVVSSD